MIKKVEDISNEDIRDTAGVVQICRLTRAINMLIEEHNVLLGHLSCDWTDSECSLKRIVHVEQDPNKEEE
tara:strand:+ start:510 stop:719 length:210 start_codon:yes stop_codon:yes gene_type:complete